ncbi:putative B3 domain-containing protein At5g58280 isoform X2 [Salvia miltiorrhiza]|nr:putative B3 domain-containing protein At5g58280 isoform X2 [Salvia miltiorrhiza]XP_057789683.1 putative B3 domain-containing protein At5g58280 isoform X2 [Salvia miltiorrhiza]
MVLATMENESGNTYEDARKQRLLENKKRFEDLGIMKLSKSLTDVTKSEKPQNRQVRLKPMMSYSAEPRRSSRARNQVSYRDDVDVELPALRNRSKFNSSWTSYLARPAEEVKVASYEERARAFNCAEKLRSNLQTRNPSFIKSMVRSHVYSCFWLGLPSRFCEDYLPKSTVGMVLENEQGSEYEALFIGKRAGLSGGWRAFALDHKLDDGDALIFELIEPTRFKVYIVRTSGCQNENGCVVASDTDEKPKKKRKTKDGNQTEKPAAEVSTTRRSLRKKGN